ncbi:hypothetical protein L1987_58016 [Smallanthus sonchifolius]|uniref:Uncharacterized protein n=1 Tax=Smallanthus sonchifolius TaxID=185202 RepID=A0ACB9DEX4_9ASTR|nr:hypothetical protein L1987_58016 [Smallanthus sonchifolius]
MDPLPTGKKVTGVFKRPTKEWAGPEGKKLRIEDGNGCAKCGMKHSREGHVGLNNCYQCGKTGIIPENVPEHRFAITVGLLATWPMTIVDPKLLALRKEQR